MKLLIAVLIALLLALQYELWFSSGGITDIIHLKRVIVIQQKANQKLQKENSHLTKNIRSLKTDKRTIEARARKELGMVKKDETFYQVINVHDAK